MRRGDNKYEENDVKDGGDERLINLGKDYFPKEVTTNTITLSLES